MAISKRVRFEVLRRDDFKCHYCGTVAGEKPLTIDHVVPVALGGSDDPTNLVAACPDCNAGKTSVMPGSDLVAQVNLEVEIKKAAQAKLMREVSKSMIEQEAYENQVWDLWDHHTPTYARERIRQSMKVVSFIYDWHSKGVPLSVVEKGIRIAVGAEVPWNAKWSYAAGVVRNTIGEAIERVSIIEAQEQGYNDGFDDGQIFEASKLENWNLVELLIDGRMDHWAIKEMTP